MSEKYPAQPDAQPGDQPAGGQPVAGDQSAGGESTPPLLDADAQAALVRKLQRKYGL